MCRQQKDLSIDPFRGSAKTKKKNDPNKLQMLEDSEVYATACNTAKNAYWNKWITEVNDCITPKLLWGESGNQ